MRTVGILGAGAWGTALAQAAASAGAAPLLWSRDADHAREIASARENRRHLPGIALAPMTAAPTLHALEEAELLVLAVPAQAVGGLCRRLAESALPPRPIVVAAKGIEEGSGRLMSEVLDAELPGWPLAVLSGPTFAGEVARGLPTAVTLATRGVDGELLLSSLGSRAFRPYVSEDVVGVQVAGAVKNVIAIACGIVAGRGLGENARAALITRGLAEIARLAEAKGGRAETLRGLAGLGDLTLSCTSAQSRNYALGLALGRGETPAATLTEGRYTAPAVVTLAATLGVEMPISTAVAGVLAERLAPDQAIAELLARPFREERG